MNGFHEDIYTKRHHRAYEMLQNIEAPQAYGCAVMGYMRSHRQLFVEACKRLPQSNTSHELYLCFEATWFFEGPMSWRGLDFRLVSLEERRTLLEGGWVNVGEYLEEFAQQYLLLILERPGYRVRICAGNCEITDTLPPDFVLTPRTP